MRVYDVMDKSSDKSFANRASSLSSNPDWLDITEFKTKSVSDNGFCPQWKDSQTFEFSVNFVDVAMLEFVVMDSDKGLYDDTMCKSAVPVSCIRPGLRCVQFYDQSSSQHGPFGFARVLLEVNIKYDM